MVEAWVSRWGVLVMTAAVSLGACGKEDGGEPVEEAGEPEGQPEGQPEGEPEVVDEAALTFHRDIKPLLDEKCNQCHLEGGVAPFPLETYAQVQPLLGVIRQSVEDGSMPPWQPDDACAPLEGNLSLSGEQRSKLLAWLDDGMAEGDPSTAAPSTITPVAQLDRVDMTLQLPVAYKPEIFPDDYRCFVVDWPETEEKFVTGFKTNPDNKAIVHHVIAFSIAPQAVAEYEALDAAQEGPGYTCYGGPGGQNQIGGGVGWLASWVPGIRNVKFPEGTGIRVEPGSKLVIQMHLNSLGGDPAPDRSTFELTLADEVEREAFILPFANPAWLRGDGMQIPAGDEDVSHSFAFDITGFLSRLTGGRLPNGAILIHGTGLHMHTLGSRGKASILRGGQEEECMLEIPDWDFNWQGSYTFPEPKRFEPGDELSLECHWDNSAANQPFVPVDKDGDGEMDAFEQAEPRDVRWGEGTFDEMCLTAVYVTAP